MRIAPSVAIACVALAAFPGSASAGDSADREDGHTRSTGRYVCAEESCAPFEQVDGPCFERAQSRSRSGRAATDWIAYNGCMAERGWTIPRTIDLGERALEDAGADGPPVGAAPDAPGPEAVPAPQQDLDAETGPRGATAAEPGR